MDANLINKIQALATKACNEGKILYRANLASKLAPFGVNCDSQKVADLVSEAWEALGKPDEIVRAFVSNDGRNALVEAQRLPQMLRDGDVDGVESFIRHSLNFAHDSLGILDDKLYAEVQSVMASAISLKNKIMGSGEVEQYKREIANLFERYTVIVEAYRNSQAYVRGAIDDFITLRGDIISTYHEFAMRLVDIFGDSLKAIGPNLFDFESVQWLDVDSKLDSVSLEYASLSERCGTLMGEISDSFKGMIRAVSSSLGGSKGRMDLLMAGGAILDHYLTAKEKANKMGVEVEAFRTSVENDSNLIKADKGRLLAIYTTLNNLFVPKAMTFLRFAGQLMEQDVNSIISSLYDNPQVRPLEEERRLIVNELRRVDALIVDHEQQIDLYSSMIDELDYSLKSQRSQYVMARAEEPQSPWWLFNILTLGKLQSDYGRKFKDWYETYGAFVRQFDKGCHLQRFYGRYICDQCDAVEKLSVKRRKLVKALNDRSISIRGLISASPEAKQRLLGNLRPLVAMLRLGREIAESKLDPELINTAEVFVEPQTAYGLQLTPELEEGVEKFKQSLEQKGPWGHIVASGISLAQSFAQLNAAKRQGEIDRKNYDQECEKIREKLRTYLAQVDDKSEFLREVMRKANLADTPEERKDALMLMSEVGGLKLSDDEFEDFLSGKHQIEL